MTLSVLDPRQVDEAVEFHGHMCPGLAMGIAASRIALSQIGRHAADEEVVAVVETDMCAADAVQVMTGCTFGKGNFIYRDHGKVAFTFYGREVGRAIRVVLRPDAWEGDPLHEEHMRLMERRRSGAATPEEEARFRELHDARARRILDTDPEALFKVEEVHGAPPPRARIHASVHCADCGEAVMETRIRRLAGRDLCIPCFEAALART